MADFIAILILLALVGLGIFGWRSTGIKARAVMLAKQHCQQYQLQFLDDTIRLYRLGLQRDTKGTLGILRTYMFEFASTGDARYRGKVILLGRAPQRIEVEPHRIN